MGWAYNVSPRDPVQKLRRENAQLRPGDGASIGCLYRAGEPSGHLRARVAPTPFVRRCAARADPLSNGCVWQSWRCSDDAALASSCTRCCRCQSGESRWARARWSNSFLKIGWLARCCKFSAPAAGKAPYGADYSFLREGGGEERRRSC